MLAENLRRNSSEVEAIRTISESGRDGPVLMLNINTYTPDAGYPDGELYRRYLAGLERLLESLGASIKWRLPVLGQPVGKQARTDEILAIWFPTHQAYLDLPSKAGGDENYRLRSLCVEAAVIHRCPGDISPAP